LITNYYAVLTSTVTTFGGGAVVLTGQFADKPSRCQSGRGLVNSRTS